MSSFIDNYVKLIDEKEEEMEMENDTEPFIDEKKQL